MPPQLQPAPALRTREGERGDHDVVPECNGVDAVDHERVRRERQARQHLGECEIKDLITVLSL